MAEDDRKAAKQRVFFPRAERMKKEAAQNPGPANPFEVFTRFKADRAAAASIPISEYFKGKKIPESLKDVRVYKTPNGPVFTRPERPVEQARRERETQKSAERRAAAHVAMQFKQQQADQIAEHRRQTSRLRAQHREQLNSLSHKYQWLCRDIETLHDQEQQALKEFDAKRRSLAGRTAEIVKGKAHFDAQRKELQKTLESDRLHKYGDLGPVKERSRTTLIEQHRQQVRERKAMFIEHRQARLDMQQQHDRDRPRLVAERQNAVARNAEIERGHKQERTEEKRFSLRSEFGRG
jgi:hypothetical protein